MNSRRFSFALEQEWSAAPAGAAVLTDLEQLANALRQLPAGRNRWVLKAEFGMSARERVLGSGSFPSEAAIGWARRRLATDGVLFLEPWLERIDEAGIQITVPPISDGQPVLEGLTPLLTDRSGAYRGSRFGPDESLHSQWQPAVDVALKTAERMQRAGYFGPLGIDAMRFQDHDGQIHLRPFQDFNARWTMGRLALGLRRLLKPGETGTWLHLRWSGASLQENRRLFDEAAARLPATVRVVRTSPFEIAGLPVSHGTAALIGASPADLATAESLMLAP